MIVECYDLKKLNLQYNNLDFIYKNSFFFDIETTGLSNKYNDIISITVMLFNKSWKIHQIFCQEKIDEPDAIEKFINLIKGKKYVITYNGNSFDLPFLAAKAKSNRFNFSFDNYIKIDLYNDMRHLKNKLSLENLKLKTVEKYFEINRDDTISGSDVLVLYEAYTINRKKEFYQLILLHNYEDVLNLLSLFEHILNLYDYLLIYDNLVVKIALKDFVFKKNLLLLNANVIYDLPSDYIYPALNFDLNISAKLQKLTIKIPLNIHNGAKIKKFHYLKTEDYNIEKFKTIDGLRKNLIPIQYNDEILYDNIISVVKHILELQN